MKTQRRQDLKTNELSVYITQLSEFVAQHAVAIIVSGVVLLGAVGAVVYANHTTALNRQLSWQAYRDALQASQIPDPENDDWVRDVVTQWQAVVVDYGDVAVSPQASWQLVDFCLRQFISADDEKLKAELLDSAERSCRTIIERYPQNTSLRAAALNGLAAVEQNRYVLDGDLAHKDRSRAYLEQIRNGKEFLSTPFQTAVLDRLNDFDRMWQPLVLVEPPPAAEPTPDSADQDLESSSKAVEPEVTPPADSVEEDAEAVPPAQQPVEEAPTQDPDDGPKTPEAAPKPDEPDSSESEKP